MSADEKSQLQVVALRADHSSEEDFDDLFSRYYPRIVAFFARRGFTVEESRDLAQETFLRVHRGLSRFRGETCVESWLFAIAANVWRNTLRDRAAAKRDVPLVSLEETLEHDSVSALISALGDGPLADYIEKERLAILRREFGKLPAQMRRCLWLRTEQQLKYREIAKILQISIQTVKSTLFKARERLKRDLAPHYPEIEFELSP